MARAARKAEATGRFSSHVTRKRKRSDPSLGVHLHLLPHRCVEETIKITVTKSADSFGLNPTLKASVRQSS
jgi:hypothetical protein